MNKIIISSLILLTLLVSGCTNNINEEGGELSLQEALEIAQNSECVEQGSLGNDGTYNEYTNTWWIDFEPSEEKPGCNPACVVSETTKTAEINWRCTGVIVE